MTHLCASPLASTIAAPPLFTLNFLLAIRRSLTSSTSTPPRNGNAANASVHSNTFKSGETSRHCQVMPFGGESRMSHEGRMICSVHTAHLGGLFFARYINSIGWLAKVRHRTGGHSSAVANALDVCEFWILRAASSFTLLSTTSNSTQACWMENV